MKFRHKLMHSAVVAVLGGIAGGTALALPALAETIELAANDPLVRTTGSRVLDTVKVTAQKREESVQEVPTAISVLGGDDLLDSGVGRGAAEILSYVPNASAGTQLHGRPRWWIRGVGTGVQSLDTPNPVGIYLDDVYISNASATGFPLFDLDRVEVLRGPQGTLWGKNTTGGAINFISKKPGFSPDGYLKVDYGTYEDKTIEGAFGGAVRGEQLAARGAFHHEARDGRFDNRNTGNKDGSLEDSAFRLQVLGAITDNLEVLGNIHMRKYHTDGTTSTVTGIGPGGAYRFGYVPSKDINDVSTNAPNSSDQKQNGASLNIRWNVGGLEFTSITGYEDFDSESFSDGDNTPLELSRSASDGKSNQWSQEFRLTSPREDRWNWIAGLHYFQEDIYSETASAKLYRNGVADSAPTGAPNYSNATFTHETTSYAAFGSTTFNFTDDFDVTAGLRWTSEKKKVDSLRVNVTNSALVFADPSVWWQGNVNIAPTPTVVLDSEKTWNDWTYDLTPQYRINDHLRVYAKFAKGFRSGGYNTAATSQLAISGEYEVVKPEYLTSYELGVKSEWFEGRLNANATVFAYDYDDIQVNVVGVVPGSNGASVSLLQNVKHGKASGAELEIEAIPLQDLHVTLALGYLDTEFTDFDVQSSATTVTSYAGNRFVRSPNVSGVLGVDYRLAIAGGGSVLFGADVKAQSDQFYFTTNQSNPRLGSGGYALTNARVSYTTADTKVTYTAYVNNLTDEEYLNHALPGVAGSTGDTAIWGDPRTAGVSATLRW